MGYRERRSLPEIHAPAIEAAVGAFAKAFKGEKGLRGKETSVRRIFEEFFREQVAQTELVESSRYGVRYLHSAVDSAEIAKALYRRYTGFEPRTYTDRGTKKVQNDEFIFSSFFNPRNPSALFVFFEQGLNHLVRELPDAIGSLKRGEEPEHHVIHYVGTPTRDIGRMTARFAEAMEDGGAFNTFGDLYAELVRSIASKDTPRSVTLRGISLGAPFALKTAEHLIADGTLSQESGETRKPGVPRLIVRIDTPPSQNETHSLPRALQTPLGYTVAGIQSFFTDPMTRASANPFVGQVVEELMPHLELRGIHEEMHKEQKASKEKAIARVLAEFYAGIPVPPGLKVTEVVGLDDMTMFLPFSRSKREAHAAAAVQREVYGGTLGERIVSDDPKRRTFGINATHTIPNLTPTVLKRLHRAAEAIEGL